MKNLILVCMLILSGVATAENKSDHEIFDKFGDWSVRHVFDKETLKYRFSDAKTHITTSQGGKWDFQFSRNAETKNVNFIMDGWLQKVTLKVDGKEYVRTQSNFHTFYGRADLDLLNAISKTKNPIEVTIIAGRWQGKEVKGTLSAKGSSAALRWIRAIK